MSKYRNTELIDELIIHCAATPNGKNFTIADIDDWHKERGFQRSAAFVGVSDYTYKHVGYHIVIDLYGNIQNGRKFDETGAHARGHNSRAIGICLIGTDKFTIEQWDTLKYFVESVLNRFPDIKIAGHNEISNKICPGFNVQKWFKGGMKPAYNGVA